MRFEPLEISPEVIAGQATGYWVRSIAEGTAHKHGVYLIMRTGPNSLSVVLSPSAARALANHLVLEADIVEHCGGASESVTAYDRRDPSKGGS